MEIVARTIRDAAIVGLVWVDNMCAGFTAKGLEGEVEGVAL